MPFTADGEAAERVTRRLIEDTGAEALLIGDSAFAYQLEAAAAMVIQQLFAGADPLTVLTFIRAERKPI